MFIGTDIVKMDRIQKIIESKDNKTIDKIFTNKEKDICINKRYSFIHFSGKFAAKEAVKKAVLSSKTINSLSLNKIEIDNDENGMPCVNLLDSSLKYNYIKVSISHDGNYAIATAFFQLK